MIPRTFPESNTTMLAPRSMPNCDNVEAYVGETPEGDTVTITHWQMSAEELEECNRNGGRVWLLLWGKRMQPASVRVASPFKSEG